MTGPYNYGWPLPGDRAAGTADERLRVYLDETIRIWRKTRDEASDQDKWTQAVHYIDALQSVRVSMLGSVLLPDHVSKGGSTPVYCCPRCPAGTELDVQGDHLWCPAEHAVIPWNEVQE